VVSAGSADEGRSARNGEVCGERNNRRGHHEQPPLARNQCKHRRTVRRSSATHFPWGVRRTLGETGNVSQKFLALSKHCGARIWEHSLGAPLRAPDPIRHLACWRRYDRYGYRWPRHDVASVPVGAGR
jgi:hypothetical protein